MTKNYIDVRHDSFSLPNDDGIRVRTTDVWYATRPSAPEFGIVDYNDKLINDQEAEVKTAWCLEKAGLDRLYIFDRDDINGLRKLLDLIEVEFDKQDMEALHTQLSEDLDNPDEDE